MLAVVGPDAADVAARLREGGLDATSDGGAPGEATGVVALGPAGLARVATDGPRVPVLPVGTDAGVPSVPEAALVDAAKRLADGRYESAERAVLDVEVGGETHRALLDVALVTAEPAQISGYRVTAGPDGTSRTLAEVRADGVVVATPSGSAGYARDAGGPTLLPGTDALAVVPIAPFTVDRQRWVAPPPLEVTVTRDEGTVALHVDGRDRGTVAVEESVRIARGGRLTLARVPDSAGDVAAMEKT